MKGVIVPVEVSMHAQEEIGQEDVSVPVEVGRRFNMQVEVEKEQHRVIKNVAIPN